MDIKIISFDSITEIMEVEVDGERLTNKGFDMSCRKVYIFDDFVIKTGDDDQNIQEANVNRRIFDEDREFFPEILGYVDDGENSFLIQEKIDVDGGRHTAPTETQRLLLDSLKEKYNLGDMGFMDENSYWNHNVIPVGENSLKIWDAGCEDW